LRPGIQRAKRLGGRRAAGAHQHPLIYRAADHRRGRIGRHDKFRPGFSEKINLFNLQHRSRANHRPLAKLTHHRRNTLLPVRRIERDFDIAKACIY
jgi:hypothetical protein